MVYQQIFCNYLAARFTDEEKMMKEAVTKLAHEEIKPYVSKMDKEAKMDPAVLQMLFDNGIMGIEIPEHFGTVP